MYCLHVYGIDHTRASLPVRENLAFSPEELQDLLATLRADKSSGIHEAMVLSTCNRTEFYLVRNQGHEAYPLAALAVSRAETVAAMEAARHYHLMGRDAIAHLFAVASSLRSQLPGDTQIGSQVAAAAQLARNAKAMGPYLEHITARALHTAKWIRRETGIAAGRGGMGPAVLRAIRRYAQPATAKREVSILMLGAGALAEEVLTHLTRSSTTSTAVRSHPAIRSHLKVKAIWSRNRSRAAMLANEFGAHTFSRSDVLHSIPDIDVVIGACRGRVSLLDRETLMPLLEKRTRPLLVIDLGMPRNLDPEAAASDAIHLLSLDELQSHMQDQSDQRADSLRRAELIVAEAAAATMRWWTNRSLHRVRGELFLAVETVLRKWRHQDPAQMKRLRPAIHRSLAAGFEKAEHNLI